MPSKNQKSDNRTKGLLAEQKAVTYLQSNGYIVLDRNFTIALGEIDIIAKKDNVLVFVEVKSRRSMLFGFPELAVNASKQNKIKAVADAYLELHATVSDIRFDIISITPEEIYHIEDAF